MKYSRPVWELMGDCAGVLPDTFRFAHVQRWFDAHYPDINERTLRVHLIGLTEGVSNPNPFLAKKPPLFRRIEHGEYEVIGRAVDIAIPDVVIAPAESSADHQRGPVLFVGYEDRQREMPAPARDLFLAAEFVAVRAAADGQRRPWFVITSEYGLIGPDVVVAPYGRRLARERRGFRHAWAQWVVAKAGVELGGLDELGIDIHADPDLVGSVVELLESAGARVRTFFPEGTRPGEAPEAFPAHALR